MAEAPAGRRGDEGSGGGAGGARRKRPSGRRRGDSGTRDAILAAAREQFAEKGYRAATLRGIAGGAGVDMALVGYFFGDKQALFTAALDLPAEVPESIVASLQVGPDRVGERFTRVYLGLWNERTTREPMLALFRSVVTGEQAASLLNEFLRTRVLEHVVPALGVDRPEVRAALAASHLLGTAVARYVLRIEPIVALDHDELVTAVAPAIHHYLTGDLAAGSPTSSPWNLSSG